jgi:hypothetical protein
MTVIGSPDLLKLNDELHTIPERVFLPVPKTVVATATINQTTFTYPVAALTVASTSGWANIKTGMLVFIGTAAGLYDVGIAVVRKAPGASTLYIDAKSLGDPGRGENYCLPLQPGQHITIIKHYPLFSIYSRIYNQVFYKLFDVPYSDQLINPDPVCNVGPWDWAFVGPSNTATTTFSCASSFVWGNKIKVAQVWDIDGGTLAGGSSLSDEEIEVEFDPGFYIISCTITDSGGKSHTARTYRWICTRSGADAPFSYRYAVNMASDRETPKGRDLRIRFSDNTPAINEQDLTFPTQGWLYAETPRFGGEEVSEGVIVDKCVGYLEAKSHSVQRGITDSTIEIKSPLQYILDMGIATQSMSETSTPTNWAEIPVTLSNPYGALWYVLHWHCPNFLSNHDYIVPDDYLKLRKQSFVLPADNFGGQIKAIEDLSVGNVGCRSDGALVLEQHPFKWLSNTERASLTTRMSLQQRHAVDESLEAGFNWKGKVSSVTGYSFAFDGGAEAVPFGAIAPGRNASQGSSKPTFPTFIVPVSENQGRTSQVVGNVFALENRERPTVRLTVDRNLDVFTCANVSEMYLLDIEALYIGGEAVRAVPTNITRTWTQRGRGWEKRIVVDFDLEAFGQPGEVINIPRSAAWNWIYDGWLPELNLPLDPKIPEFPDLSEAQFGVMFAVNSLGEIGRTSTLLEKTVHWESFRGNLIGRVLDFVILPDSDYITSNYTAGDLELFAVAYDDEAEEIRIYSTADGRAFAEDVVWAEEYSASLPQEDFFGSACIVTPHDSSDIIFAAWSTVNGTKFWRLYSGSDDNGTVGASADGGGLDKPLAATIIGDDVYCCGALLLGGWQIFRAQNAGSFTALNNHPGTSAKFAEAAPVLNHDTAALFASANLLDDQVTSTTQTSFEEYPFGEGSSTWQRLSSAPAAINQSVYYGLHSVIKTPLQEDGYVHTVERLAFRTEVRLYYKCNGVLCAGDPPGPPNYYPPNNWDNVHPGDVSGSWTFYWALIDDEGDFLYTAEPLSFTLIDNPPVGNSDTGIVLQPEYLPASMGFTRIRYRWFLDIDKTFASEIENVAGVVVYLRSDDQLNFGTGQWNDSSLSNINLVEIHLNDAFFELDTTRNKFDGFKEYRISSPSGGSPAWTEISPGASFAARTAYAFANDLNSSGDNTIIQVAINNKGERQNLRSLNVGDAWTVLDTKSAYDGVRASTPVTVFFGFNAIDLAVSNPRKRYPRIGDWASSIGPVGFIRKVQGLG